MMGMKCQRPGCEGELLPQLDGDSEKVFSVLVYLLDGYPNSEIDENDIRWAVCQECKALHWCLPSDLGQKEAGVQESSEFEIVFICPRCRQILPVSQICVEKAFAERESDEVRDLGFFCYCRCSALCRISKELLVDPSAPQDSVEFTFGATKPY